MIKLFSFLYTLQTNLFRLDASQNGPGNVRIASYKMERRFLSIGVYNTTCQQDIYICHELVMGHLGSLTALPMEHYWSGTCYAQCLGILLCALHLLTTKCPISDMFAPRQWETALLCNDVSHWLGAKSSLNVKCCRPYDVIVVVMITRGENSDSNFKETRPYFWLYQCFKCFIPFNLAASYNTPLYPASINRANWLMFGTDTSTG